MRFRKPGSFILILLIASLSGSWTIAQRPGPRTSQSGTKELSAKEIARMELPAVVLLVCDDPDTAGSTQGSGFFIKPGILVTNYHVIKGNKRGVVQVASGNNRAKKTFRIARVIDFDEESDLALLSVPSAKPAKVPFLTLSSELANAEVGETVYALGNPEGLIGTISPGIVSASLRSSKKKARLQITAPISHGSSGGPVVNSRGQVIGVAEKSLTEGQNLNFAVPSFLIAVLLNKAELPDLLTDIIDTETDKAAKGTSNWIWTTLPTVQVATVTEDLPRSSGDLGGIEAVIRRFDTGLASKNWEDVYEAGTQLLTRYPDEFRDMELVLGSIGLDETAKRPRVTIWNDQTLIYARMSIADLEAGKTFKNFGVNPFKYANKDDALGWMNYTIGFITAIDKNNKKDAVSYLYKATQFRSATRNNPVVYETIGLYYFDEINRLTDEIRAMIAAREEDTVEAIKAKVALVNGTAERTLDVYARAYKLAPTDAKNKPYRDKLYKNLQDVYKLRFGKPEGMDAWIAAAPAKPFPNPSTPVTPISDP